MKCRQHRNKPELVCLVPQYKFGQRVLVELYAHHHGDSDPITQLSMLVQLYFPRAEDQLKVQHILNYYEKLLERGSV